MKLKLTEEQRKQVLSAYENKELIELEVFEPKQKIIKLDEIVESGIDMEFSAGSETSWGVGLLGKIGKAFNSTVYFGMANFNGHHSIDSSWSSQCRIRQDHWHSWQGYKCPLPDGLIIGYSSTAGARRMTVGIREYAQLDWSLIYEFKVYGTADDARYEWQEGK